MSELRHAHRGPLTWWVFEPTDQLAVMCSQSHRSFVQHHVTADGALRAPTGCQSSMHCGACNEDLPLRLADCVMRVWPAGALTTETQVEVRVIGTQGMYKVKEAM